MKRGTDYSYLSRFRSSAILAAVLTLTALIPSAAQQTTNGTDTIAPQVFPPKNLTISHTETGGARPKDSQSLQNFLGGGKARDNVDPNPQRLSPQIGGVDVTDSTLLPEGATAVTFRFRDAAGNVGTASANVTVLDLEDGDLFAGGGIGDNGFGGFESWGIYRVRGTQATLYCQAGQDSDYWTLPTNVMVDSAGRVVFLANVSPFLSGNTALLRCGSLGAMPEKLAIFRAPGSGPSTGYPDPFPNRSFQALRFNGLHLETSEVISIDDNTQNGLPQISGGDSYVFSYRAGDSAQTTASLRYFPDTNQWLEGPPIGDTGHDQAPDMAFHSGTTYVFHSGILFRHKNGLQVDVSGTAGGFNFDLTLILFGGSSELSNALTAPICGECGLLVHDLATQPVDSGCKPNPPASTAVATGVLTGDNIAYDEYTGHGLVLGTGEVGSGAPFLTEVSEALLDNPGDLSQYFTNPGLGCGIEPEVYFRSVLPFFGQNGINGFSPLVSSTHGIVGVAGSGVALMAPGVDPTDQAFLISNQPWVLSAGFHSGLGAWPPRVSSGNSADVIVRVDSPVNVLVTSPDGKKIGMDDSGQPMNDFGADGFDSGPGEPRFFAINNPSSGAYSMELKGTGDGQYAVHVYSNDTMLPVGSHIVTTGTAAPGSAASADFTLAPDLQVAFVTPQGSDTIPPNTIAALSPQPNVAGWNSSDVTLTLAATDDPGGSGVKQIAYSATGAQTIAKTVLQGASAAITIQNEGKTTISYFATDVAGNMETQKQLLAKIDKSAPIATCAGPDGNWHATDVSIGCVGSDSVSGLANPSDVAFSLATSVSAGTETANALTASRNLCDIAGNCASAGPIGGNKIDKKAPSITISAPVSGTYVLNQPVTASYTCSDGGSGIASCSGPVASGASISTAVIGSNSFTVNATDQVGNVAAPHSVNYTIAYKICALYDQNRSVHGGSTIPLKLQLCDAMGADVSSPSVVLHATKLVQASSNAAEVIQDSGNANPDNDFRYDSGLGATGGYTFNLSTKGLTTGMYTLSFVAGTDPTTHTALFQVR